MRLTSSLSCELQFSILHHRVNATFFVSECLLCLSKVSFYEIDFLFQNLRSVLKSLYVELWHFSVLLEPLNPSLSVFLSIIFTPTDLK